MYMRNSSGFCGSNPRGYTLPPNYRGQLSENDLPRGKSHDPSHGEDERYEDEHYNKENRFDDSPDDKIYEEKPGDCELREEPGQKKYHEPPEGEKPSGLLGGLFSGTGGILSRIMSMFGLGGEGRERHENKEGFGGFGGITDWIGQRISRIDADDLIILAIIYLLLSDGADDDVLLILLFLFFFVA